MKNRKIVSVLVLMVFSLMVTYGQKVTGIVYMVDEPLEGAKVLVESADQAIKTDHNGYFSIDVKGMTTLNVTYKKTKASLNVNEITGFVDVVLVPAEKTLARMIVNSASIAKCDAYIKAYPKGKKVSLVKEKLDELSFIQAYDAAVSQNNLKLMEKYLADFPYGDYTDKASKTLDVVSWQKARSIGTQEAYEAYMSKFPNGEAIKLAREKVAMINE